MENKEAIEILKRHRLSGYSEFNMAYDLAIEALERKTVKANRTDNNISNSPNGNNYETQDEYFGRK